MPPRPPGPPAPPPPTGPGSHLSQVLVQLLQDSGSKRDVYGRIGYANTYLYTAPKDRRDDNQKKAEARFGKVGRLRGLQGLGLGFAA